MHHLVLADDSKTTQTLVRLSFAEEPALRVHTFDDGDSALRHVQQQPTDVVLAKLSLPQLDGYELCRRIKQDPTLSHVRVLLLGRAHEPFDENRAQQNGFDGCLIKPFETSELVARIKTLLIPTPSEPTPTPGSNQSTEDPGNLRTTSEPTVRLLTLNPSQCRPDGNFLARKVRRQQPPPSSATGSATLNEVELERLIQGVMDRLPKELRRILPEIIQETLSAPARPVSAD